ncbi:MAG: amino acid adenylation domain-containing protein, partial [Acidobacteriota bacterium]
AEHIGSQESFFERGGHSLLATQLVSRIRAAFQVELPLRTVFEAPTLAAQAQRIEQARRKPGPSAPPLRPVSRAGKLPLSFAQQRMWFLHQLDPQSPAYNIFTPIPLPEGLDVRALQAAFNAVVCRHETLRTRFPSENGEPVQVIEDAARVPIPVIDLASCNPSQGESELNRLQSDEALRPFDLGKGSLIRVALVLLEGQGFRAKFAKPQRESGFRNLEPESRSPKPIPSSVLLLSMHHIISDAWSLGVLSRELRQTYQRIQESGARSQEESVISGQLSVVSSERESGASASGTYSLQPTAYSLPPPLPLQYADFAVWQRHWLTGEVLREQMDYWRQQLEGAPPLELPADRARPARLSFRGGAVPFAWPPRLLERLQELSRSCQATLFMTLAAAFQALLSRYCNQNDVSLGTPIANRNRAETEGLIGFFVNTLVLRSDLSGQPSFRRLLEQLRETALQAYSHQDLPFEQLVEALHPERSLSRSPLFQVMFVLHNAAPGEVPASQQAPTAAAGNVTSRFDLTLTLTEGPGLSGAAVYSTDLFESSSMRRLLRHFRVLLESVADDPKRSVHAIPLLSQEERQQALAEWNDSHAEPSRMRALPAVFKRQVDERGDALAVVCEPDSPAPSLQPPASLSYSELQHQAGKVARALQSAGVRPESLVAIFAERSLEMVTGLLGILRAGGAYLPLDPAYPAARLAVMLEDARPAAVLVQAGLEGRLEAAMQPEGLRSRRVVLESVLEGEGGQGDPKEVAFSPDQMAYVMYTSGSTGLPKGVAVTHRAVAGLVRGNNYARLNAAQVILQMATISFDASTFQIWGSLLNGARLVLYPPRRPTLEELQRVLARHGVTMLGIPAALFRLMVEDSLEALASVPQVLSGGDVLSAPHARRALQAGLGRLINAYGPTENTTYTCCHVMEAPPEGSLVPIGRPVAGSEVFVLDRLWNPVPIGVAGELFAGGEGLARGYLGRPQWTAERFVPHAFGAGERLYRTGDLVRRLWDGRIEFLGRLDHQSKIRGYRVEPAEIEAALCRDPGVRQAAVLARGEAGNRSLVAFVVGGEEERGGRNRRERRGRTQRVAEKSSPRPLRLLSASSAVQSPDLRSHLRAHLPDYMIPSRIVELDELPLTPSGKVDRQALLSQIADPKTSQPPGPSPQPQSPAEELIVGIWAEVLQVEQVGAQSSFFDLGGHSLLATQAVSRIRRALGVELPLRAIFEAPTPAQLARRIEEARLLGSVASPPPIRPVPRDRPLPLSFAQQRLWFLDQLVPGSPLYNIPSAVRLKGPLEAIALQAALNAVRYRHESLRTCFPVIDGQAVQSIQPWHPVPLPLVDLSGLAPEIRPVELQRLADDEAQRPFDLQSGPLVRTTLILLADADHALLATLHHIVSDAWSSGILIAELSNFYKDSIQSQESGIPSSCLLPPASSPVGSWQLAVGSSETEPGTSQPHSLTASQPSPPSSCLLPLQYADFAVWQREWMSGGELKRQLGYWKERLAGAPVLDLPSDHPRPAQPSLRGAVVSFVWPERLMAELRRLARSQDATLFMTLLAAFQALLSRYLGQDDISLGSPIANRNREETEGLIGFFVNTLVIRTDLSGEPDFAQLLARVRDNTLDAYAHQDFPFEQLVEALQPQRRLNRTPLFQVMFVLQNAPAGSGGGLAGVEMTPMGIQPSTSQFDLTISISEGDFLWGAVEYSTDLFEASTIRRLIGHLQILLESAAADPHQKIGNLAMLSQAQRHQLLREWSPRTYLKAYPDSRHSFIGIFQATAQRSPDALAAVSVGSGQLAVGSSEKETGERRPETGRRV